MRIGATNTDLIIFVISGVEYQPDNIENLCLYIYGFYIQGFWLHEKLKNLLFITKVFKLAK